MYQFASPLMQRMLPFFQRLNPNSAGSISTLRTPETMLDIPVHGASPSPTGPDNPIIPQPAPRDTDYVNGQMRRPPQGLMEWAAPPAAPAPSAPSTEWSSAPPQPQPADPQQQTGHDGNPFPTPFGSPQGNPFPTPIGSPQGAPQAAFQPPPATTDTLDDANLMRGAAMNAFFKNSFPSFYKPNVG